MASPGVHVLVTGGAGFVGAAIVRACRIKHPEWKITILDIKKPKDLGLGVEFFEADIRNATEVHNALEWTEPNVIIHSAGIVPQGPARYSNIMEDQVTELNIKGTENILEAAIDSSVKALVFTSSSQVIADDLSHDYPNFDETVPYPASSLIYGQSKAKAEALVLDANSSQLSTCALRPSVIPGQEDYQLIPAIHACIAKGETPFQIGNGDNLYDFTFVSNVADAHLLATENLLSSKTAAGHAILISNGQPITFRDFCLAVWAEFDHVPSFTLKIPTSFAWLLGLIAEYVAWIFGTRSTLSRGSVQDAFGVRYCNPIKAKEILGYEPRVHLADGIRISCEAYKTRLERARAANGRNGIAEKKADRK